MPVPRLIATANTWIPAYRPRYDEFLAGLAAMDDLRAANINNAQKQFREKFLAKTGDGGNKASWDSALRERELDGDGIAGEVIFPDADVLGIGGVTSSPFGTGLAASGSDDPELAMAGARAHNRWLADLCSESPPPPRRHRDGAGHPRRRGRRRRDRASARVRCVGRRHDPHASGLRTRPTTIRSTTRCGRPARSEGWPSPCTRVVRRATSRSPPGRCRSTPRRRGSLPPARSGR